MKKFEFKDVEIEIEHQNVVEELNKYGLEGWRPVRFSDSYEKTGRMLPASNEIWVMTITLEREINTIT